MTSTFTGMNIHFLDGCFELTRTIQAILTIFFTACTTLEDLQ